MPIRYPNNLYIDQNVLLMRVGEKCWNFFENFKSMILQLLDLLKKAETS